VENANFLAKSVKTNKQFQPRSLHGQKIKSCQVFMAFKIWTIDFFGYFGQQMLCYTSTLYSKIRHDQSTLHRCISYFRFQYLRGVLRVGTDWAKRKASRFLVTRILCTNTFSRVEINAVETLRHEQQWQVSVYFPVVWERTHSCAKVTKPATLDSIDSSSISFWAKKQTRRLRCPTQVSVESEMTMGQWAKIYTFHVTDQQEKASFLGGWSLRVKAAESIMASSRLCI
jgi:hypothetical protein